MRRPDIYTVNLADVSSFREMHYIVGHYVYFYLDPRDNSFFYVGKGKKQRAINHWKYREAHHNAHFRNKMVAIEKAGLYPEIKIVVFGEEKLALEAEVFYISALKRTLVNYTDGGDGISGYKHTPESIAKRLETISAKGGIKAWNKGLAGDSRCRGGRPKGIPMSDEAKQKLSEAMKGKSKDWLVGKKPWNYGKTKETHPSLAASSESMKGNNRGKRKTGH